MSAVSDISIIQLSCFFALLVLPGLLFRYLHLYLTRAMIIGFTRMILQCSLVAVYLEYIFAWDNMAVNLLWILIMVLVANSAILKQSHLSFPRFITVTYPCYAALGMIMLASFLIVLDIEVLCSARYFIPLAGMLFGNMLRANVVALDRLYSQLLRREDEYMAYMAMGATRMEALRPFIREACQAAFGPQLASVSTMGLVALPGMMTGQILGGSSPAVAIKYQMMITAAIFLTSTLSSFFAIMVSTLKSFDGYGGLKREIFLSR